MRVGFENTCTAWEKSNVSCFIPQLYGWVYKTWRLFPLVDEHNVAVMAAGSQSTQSHMGSQFSISVLLKLCSESVGA